ncbi:ArsR family transcriptional regulator [Levilactobacillus brevis]|uniref:ArsR/SmtB family transcription factor n=1 Tax=Levilactobacillus brevis TaxID=1580 RepID=UPI001C119CDA|nr:helix-turn-helix transcriptional regulator [Levilactobacillus brevis]MBU5273421.1 ArsR family transcriptional regulator [Levilactobacillus brevis]MDM5047668.1 helix-turn-helix transcriptional regulator [Levilactobacillus brevis]
MKENLPNIDLNKVTLTQILKSLSDPIRLEIVTKLFKESKECSCAIFNNLGKKSNLSQHYRNLRLNGLISVRHSGIHSYLTLRQAELDHRFPNLLKAIIDNWHH